MAIVQEEFSFIEDKGELGFIDFDDDKSVCSYKPEEEGSVIISVPFPPVNGKPQSITVGESSSIQITINNTNDESVELWTIDIYDSNPKDSFTLSLMEPPSANSDPDYVQRFRESFSLGDRVLLPHKILTVWLTCKPKDIGLHTTVVNFDLEGVVTERMVFLLAEDKVSQFLTSNKPYRRDRKTRLPEVYNRNNFVAGSPPPRNSNRRCKVKLPMHKIPDDVRGLLEAKQIPESITLGLTKENYCQFFKTLLIMEEIKLEDVMRGYDMENISFRNKGLLLALEVPGLAEKRPSLVYGDFILVKSTYQDPNNEATPTYQGHIHRVEAEVVLLKFADDFYSQHNSRSVYNVQFTYNRVNMRRLYQAIEAAESLGIDFLFPSESSEHRRVIKPINLSSTTFTLNEEQTRSVEMILGCRGGSPYVIYGPPGTGKTVTLVESVLQLYTRYKNAKILVCAPSNSAADHVLEMLIGHVQVNDVFRLNAIARPFEEINPDILQFTYHVDGVFQCPLLSRLKHFRITVCTYMSACLLYAEGVSRGHFSHIFLDEAGQASEPETMIPISHFSNRNTVVVLAGDPKQLGPVIHSKESEVYGMGMSYLERLFECGLYKTMEPNYVTELVRNYRCEPEILYISSKLFYAGSLIACKDEESGFATTCLDFLPNKEFPVVYIGVQGCDEREGNNPSWFNRFEASKVVEIITSLKENQVVSPECIGVITPYRQQVLKLTRALEDFGCSGVKVGSVEQFQGQEKDVIIVSTVRSTIKHNEFDKTYCLGFLSNPKRFNVAITRAKSLMIIIGNPHITSKDPYWNALLWYCVDGGSYMGCILPEREKTILEEVVEEVVVVEEEDGFNGDYNIGKEFPEMESTWSATGIVDEAHDGNMGKEFPEMESLWSATGIADEAHDDNNGDHEWTETINDGTLSSSVVKPSFNEDDWEDGWK
ncbi:probable RNA helicase SDE3 [Impatiens glandulifera]|uniref:probable RNA helicase SDE3 n=1 Tax=Impatiens glandulifera TaxID=253017 RepID=UPI001FB07949|nr:probable RNA helicase SDE3 [Impatiens glandulifera]XP_047333761.1 probable RNA helicase SDE3 [Impatiens glandulifera]